MITFWLLNYGYYSEKVTSFETYESMQEFANYGMTFGAIGSCFIDFTIGCASLKLALCPGFTIVFG
jgi:hypothetical protein